MKALITGHKGFIGTVLNAHLEANGWEVSGIDLKDGWDVANPVYLGELPTPDVIFHLAAHPEFPSRNTVDAMYTVIEYAKKINAHLVFASSAAVIGDSVYGCQKKLCEALIKRDAPNIMWSILRFQNVFGHDGHGVIDRFIRAYRAKEPLTITGSGEQARDFIHVDDVVQAMRLVAEKQMIGTTDIGTGKVTKINDLLNYFPGAKVSRVPGDIGIYQSVAYLNPGFSWYPNETDIEHYIKKELE